jgi:hypothetical protein
MRGLTAHKIINLHRSIESTAISFKALPYLQPILKVLDVEGEPHQDPCRGPSILSDVREEEMEAFERALTRRRSTQTG